MLKLHRSEDKLTREIYVWLAFDLMVSGVHKKLAILEASWALLGDRNDSCEIVRRIVAVPLLAQLFVPLGFKPPYKTNHIPKFGTYEL